MGCLCEASDAKDHPIWALLQIILERCAPLAGHVAHHLHRRNCLLLRVERRAGGTEISWASTQSCHRIGNSILLAHTYFRANREWPNKETDRPLRIKTLQLHVLLLLLVHLLTSEAGNPTQSNHRRGNMHPSSLIPATGKATGGVLPILPHEALKHVSHHLHQACLGGLPSDLRKGLKVVSFPC